MAMTYRLTDLALPYLLDSPDISFCAKGLYILICYIQPESLAHLASASGVSRVIVRRECNALKDEGWLSFDILKSERTIITPTVRIPMKSSTWSGGKRPLVPVQFVQLVRSKSSSWSRANRPPVPGQRIRWF